ncbi:MAG: hypothetical protein WBA41_11190 [Rivularia sp. (in: cyanobacteria)]
MDDIFDNQAIAPTHKAVKSLFKDFCTSLDQNFFTFQIFVRSITNTTITMTQFNEIISLLEAERERYILEAARIERRLESIRTQVTAIDNLMSGYAQEKESYQYQQFPQSRTQAYLEEDKRDRNIVSHEDNIDNIVNSDVDLDEEKFDKIDNYNEPQPIEEVETTDIPKMKGGRQSESLPMLPQYQGYSIKNAILILMRCQPNLHFHINAIVRDLYGDKLTKKQYQTARVSVTKALSLGFQSGLWFKVLRSPGVYTLKAEKGITAKTPKGK